MVIAIVIQVFSKSHFSILIFSRAGEETGKVYGRGATSEPVTIATTLSEVGSNAAMNFLFAFLKRAWQSGEEGVGCSELLVQALESLRNLPPASLFHMRERRDKSASSSSSLWLGVVEKCSTFLRSIVLGSVSAALLLPSNFSFGICRS
jgi:hypothetical protein